LVLRIHQVVDGRGFLRVAQAQVTPKELTTKLMDAAIANGARLLIGTVAGVTVDESGQASAVQLDGGKVRTDARNLCRMVLR
jgi:glycine/D-amino acid oxidase-like deaminating enzyme